jgi:lipoprotein-anchoring transpeptidase ErfK/SrfK
VIGRSAGGWLHVRLPGRPNGSTGWIRTQSTALTYTRWQLVIDTTLRRVRVYHQGLLVKAFRAVVGKPSTPTPTGAFFVEEPVRLTAGEAGAPYALALSARSNVLQEFEGGPGQIALHGTANVGGTLGTAVSHGCIRLDTAAITWLAGRIGAGVPVTITG